MELGSIGNRQIVLYSANVMMKSFFVDLCAIFVFILRVKEAISGKTSSSSKCEKSLTTASGSKAPVGSYCPGDLIFEDTFDSFDLDTWQHENTLAGTGDGEFQWFTNNRSNSFVKEGNLYIRPTLTVDEYGEAFLRSGVLNIHGGSPADQCTKQSLHGCERIGTHAKILNPVKSASLRTVDTFAFKYGKVEISAKLPAGDWLWPGIWFLPKVDAYGGWPASGEIDLLDSKGNRDLIKSGVNVGTEQVTSKLQFGPNHAHNAGITAGFARNSEAGKGYHTGFNRYQMEWTPDHVTFSINDIETGTVSSGTGFWARGNFDVNSPGMDNPWRFGSIMAPFDQEFYFKIMLAVGGSDYFSDDEINPTKKAWINGTPHPMTDFWNARNDWLPTWKLEENEARDASLLLDYVRVWAL
ncbi:beta-1,3-glucan-binding protein-like [Toxorhynchites rutilus septentrionalis]|uniref:beta-1,3-glucan-binding protein-like n=1 Tax=Toxorhynchites rutilus septentrionalis TaxID=329112 RepID=UPI0024783300|nr:beta-1,3-glucan-binding protein-like [Toxorhynchites rutilus septentrionalis]